MEELITEIRHIREDKQSGATTLAVDILNLFGRMLEAEKSVTNLKRIQKYAGQFIEAHPSMAQIINLCRDIIEQVERVPQLTLLLSKWSSLLQGQSTATVGNAIKEASRYSRILTLSNSRLVAESLGRLSIGTKIVVGEGRPMNEGTILAGFLKDKGMDVTVVVDAMLPGMVSELDGVVVGCDCITRRYFANKIGTLALALLSAKKKVPLLVLCPSSKFLHADRSVYFRIMEHPPQELGLDLAQGTKIINKYFESIPITLAYRIITEEGAFSPSDFLNHFGEKPR